MWEENQQQRAPLLERNNKNSKEDHGEKYSHDPEFKGVRDEGRRVNDVLFAILFILAIIAFVSISALGLSKGNPERLIPSNEFSEEVENKGEYWFQDAVAIMKRDVYILAGGLGFAFVLAVAWVGLMRWFTKLFIYLTVVVGILAVLAAGVFFLNLGMQKGSPSLKYTSYAIFGIALILIIVVIILRKKIELTSALFAECCKGFQHNPSILVIGTLVFAGLAAFTIFWVAQFIYFYSIPSDYTVVVPDAPPKFNTKIRNLMYFQVFAYYWVTCFLSAVFQVSIAGGMATWYFSRDLNGYKAGSRSPAFRALARAFTLSLGSLALGSLLLAIVKFVNFLLTITKKANRTNKVVVFIISCIQCLLSCVQSFIKFVDRFAYIYIAMHGDSYCTSAKNCYNLISRNMFSAVVVDVLGGFVLFVGKLLGTAATTMLSVGVVHHLGRPISAVTVVIIAVVAYNVFSLFSNIIHVGVDTIMVCYMEDLERNKDGALYMSPELHQLLQNKVAESNNNTKQRINN